MISTSWSILRRAEEGFVRKTVGARRHDASSSPSFQSANVPTRAWEEDGALKEFSQNASGGPEVLRAKESAPFADAAVPAKQNTHRSYWCSAYCRK